MDGDCNADASRQYSGSRASCDMRNVRKMLYSGSREKSLAGAIGRADGAVEGGLGKGPVIAGDAGDFFSSEARGRAGDRDGPSSVS